jgi:predicted XRE-type DNA-binding protein
MKLTGDEYEVSSGNIFQDLGLPNAKELDNKAELALKISGIISRRRMTQTQAAQALGIDQPKVSAIVRGHLEKFSIERLCEFLTKLGCDVDIHIREKKKAASGRLTVSME